MLVGNSKVTLWQDVLVTALITCWTVKLTICYQPVTVKSFTDVNVLCDFTSVFATNRCIFMVSIVWKNIDIYTYVQCTVWTVNWRTENITSSSAMAERPRTLGNFMGLVTLRLNFRLKVYVSHQYLWTVRWGEWLYYNIATGSFHTKKLCCRIYSIEVEFHPKNKLLFELPFGGLRGNVRTPSIARWKACGWLSSRDNWIFCYFLWLRRYK